MEKRDIYREVDDPEYDDQENKPRSVWAELLDLLTKGKD